jgi:UDP-N-acetylmuramate dehydrogenase
MSLQSAVRTAVRKLEPLAGRVEVGAPLGLLTTYRVGGAAAVRVTVRREEELEVVAAAVSASELPVLVVGRGSNLLVADAGFPGLAVVLDGRELAEVAFSGVEVVAGAAAALPAVARQSVEAGLAGFEWAVGVPGSVGGAVRMNAGGHGSDTAASLVSARIFDLARGGASDWPVLALGYGYRHSAVLSHQVVTSARFRLRPGEPDAGRETIRQIVRWRRDHQPGGQNAGSVFANPPGDSAGRIIEGCGLKGRRVGTAWVSEKHANFIQAEPGGSADDIWQLMNLIRGAVRAGTGVDLRPEVRLVGFHSPQVEV